MRDLRKRHRAATPVRLGLFADAAAASLPERLRDRARESRNFFNRDVSVFRNQIDNCASDDDGVCVLRNFACLRRSRNSESNRDGQFGKFPKLFQLTGERRSN